MNERTLSVELLDDLIECSICGETFTDPRSLPCVHTYCLKCIIRYSNDKQPARNMTCPICRREFAIPVDGIGELPKNIFIAKLLAKTQATQHLDKPAAHSSSTVCDKHSTKDLEFYCRKCHEAVCPSCFVTRHNGHTYATIAEVAAEFRHGIRNNISDLQKTLKPTISNILKNVQEKRKKCVEHFDKVEKEVCARAEELKATTERHKQLLLSELNKKRAEKLKEIDNTFSAIILNEASLESIVKYSEELINKSSDCDIARESHDLTLRTTKLKNSCLEDKLIMQRESVVTLEPSKVLSESDSNVIGSLTTDEVDCEISVMTTPVSPVPARFERDNWQEQSLTESAESKPGPTLRFSAESSGSVRAVCTLNDWLYVTRDNANYVERYKIIYLEKCRNIAVRYASSHLFGIAACSTYNCLYVSDHVKNKVHRLDLSDSQSYTSWFVGSSPFGLSVNRSHNLLVACKDVNKIQEYSKDGSLIREIKDVHNLYHAVELSDRTIVMCQVVSAHSIVVKSVDGSVIKRYGSEASGSGPEQMNEPLGLAVDSKGFILVADHGNNRILVVNPDLTEARPLPLSRDVELTRPRAVWFDESRGRLYVGENDGKHRLLAFDNVNISSLFSQ